MVWWLVVCFEDRSERDKNKRNVFLMCLGTVCTDMMMMGFVCVCDGPYTVYTLLLLLLLFRRFFERRRSAVITARYFFCHSAVRR